MTAVVVSTCMWRCQMTLLVATGWNHGHFVVIFKFLFIDLFLLFYNMLNKMLNMQNNNEPNRQDTDQPHNLGCFLIMGCVCAMCRGVSELVWSGEKFETLFQVMLTFLVKWPTYSTILTHNIIGQHIHTCRILWNDGAGEKAGSRLKHDASFVWHVRYN